MLVATRLLAADTCTIQSGTFLVLWPECCGCNMFGQKLSIESGCAGWDTLYSLAHYNTGVELERG